MESPLKHNTKSLADQILELYKQLPECGLKSYMAHWFDLRTDVSAEKVAGELYEQNRPKFRDWGTLKDMCIATAIQYATIKTRAEVSSLTQQVEELTTYNNAAKEECLRLQQMVVDEQDENARLKSELEELKKEREALKAVANVAALCTLDLNANLNSAYKEYMSGELSKGAYDHVLQRHGKIFEALYNAGYTQKHPILEFPVAALNSPVKQGE